MQISLFIFCGYFSAHPALAAAGISPAPVAHSRRPDQAGKAQKITAPEWHRGGVHLFNFNISIRICTGSKSSKRIKYTLPPPFQFALYIHCPTRTTSHL
nr:MAG TPA: hypothetical protein [Caudoviricetes sp.]